MAEREIGLDFTARQIAVADRQVVIFTSADNTFTLDAQWSVKTMAALRRSDPRYLLITAPEAWWTSMLHARTN